MVDTTERITAVFEASVDRFDRNTKQAERIFARSADNIERRNDALSRRLNVGAAAGGLGIQSLINRYTSWAAVMITAQRLMRESIEVSTEAAAANDRVAASYERLAQSAGPTTGFLLNRWADLLDMINNVVVGLDRAGREIANSPILGGAGGVTIPLTPHPFNDFNTFNRSSGNWTPGPGGFPESGVTDITPKKQSGKTVAERQHELDLETLRKVEQAVTALREKQFDEDQRFKAEQFEETKRLRDSLTEEELAGLDDFHARAKQAWERYWEGVAELADDAQKLEEERVAERIAEIGNAFEYLAGAALQGGDAFKRALAGMVQSLAASGLRSLFMAGLSALGGEVPFIGNLISGARAGGGPVQAGHNYLVGEDGPEIFKAPSSGVIIPNASAARGGGTVVSFAIDARGAQVGVAEQIDAKLRSVVPAILAAADANNRRTFKTNMVKTQRTKL